MVSKTSQEIDVLAASGPDELQGRVLDGRYRVVRRLGAGGMGEVYLGEHVALGTKVAIKTLQPNLAAQERFRRRFLREARAASSIRSDHVVQITDFGTSDGTVYFVMEYLEGEDLEARLKREGPIPWSHARWLFVQILSALRAAHAKQIVHRDIKPANCFLFDDPDRGTRDDLKVLDFGLAKLGLEEDPLSQPLTATDEVFGTVAYMAPECTLGKPADARSDLYAFGILMYRTLVGELPFRAPSSYLILNMQVHAPPPSARLVNPAVPESVDAIIRRAMAKDPRDRFQTADELLLVLDQLPPELPAHASTPAGIAPRMTQMPTRRVSGAELAGPATQAASDELTDPRPTGLPGSEGPPTIVVSGEALEVLDDSSPPDEKASRRRATLLAGGAGRPVLNPRRASAAASGDEDAIPPAPMRRATLVAGATPMAPPEAEVGPSEATEPVAASSSAAGVPAALVTVPSAALPLASLAAQSTGSGLYDASGPELVPDRGSQRLQTMPSMSIGVGRPPRSRMPMIATIVVGSVVLFGASMAWVAGQLREDGAPAEPSVASAAMPSNEPAIVAAPAPTAATGQSSPPASAPAPVEPAAAMPGPGEAAKPEAGAPIEPASATTPEPSEPRREPAKASAAPSSSRPSLATVIKKIQKQARSECSTSGTFEVQARHEDGLPKKGGVTVAGNAPRTVTKCIAGVVERHRLPPSSKPIIELELEL